MRWYSREQLDYRAKLLYFDIVASAWNVTETKYPFQCYSIRAAKMCIDLVEHYGNYDFLEDLNGACRRWMRSRQRNIAIGYEYSDPYLAFLVFLVEFCVRLKKLHVKKKRAYPAQRKFQRLLLACLCTCFEQPIWSNTNQLDSVVNILRQVATDLDTRMELVIHFMNTNEIFDVDDKVATFFRCQIRAMMHNLGEITVVKKSKKWNIVNWRFLLVCLIYFHTKI